MMSSGIKSRVPAKRRRSNNEAKVPLPRKIMIIPIIKHPLIDDA